MLGWLDHRSGIKKFMALMLLEGVPGGAKWRYVWGSCLAFVFSLQVITGVMLMTAYSPSESQAWASVHYIQYKMDFGWLIRGLHHFGSQTMMVLIALHMLQVVIAGAQLPPRELNWWLGIGLLSVTLGLSLTGYLLPWDQKGYWATDVATNIAGSLPEAGGDVKQQAVAGPDSGNHTLTRFYGLHVAILPGALILMLIAHIAIFRRHGVTSPENEEGLVTAPENEHTPNTEPFWPRQAFYDMVACMIVFAMMLGAVLYGFAHPVNVERPEGEEPGLYERIARWGTEGKGAELDAAADRETAGYPARPEWYFLFLFQLLKYFPGEYAIYGTVIIPNAVMLVLFLLPLFGVGPLRIVGRFIGIVFVLVLLGGVGFLTLKALDDDVPEGILWGVLKPYANVETPEKAKEKAEGFQHAVHEAHFKAQRACQLAMDGVPVDGGHFLIRNDPFITGQQLFKVKCASCHNFTADERDKDPKHEGEFKFVSMTTGKNASDLGAFGRKEWIRGLLDNPMHDKYFGLVKRVETDAENKPVVEDGKLKMVEGLTTMKNWRKRTDDARKAGKINAEKQDKDFDKIAAWLEYLGKTPYPERKDFKLIDDGQEAFAEEKANKCLSCHVVEVRVKNNDGKFVWEKQGDPTGPELTNHGSADWIRSMIMRPGHESRYRDRNLMPAFRNKDGVGSEIHLQEFRESNKETPENMVVHLTDIEREMIIRWMLRDYRPIYGGAPIAK
jgi:quinol-cytochrome oxidoreductase complex cytochrome b subunit